MPTAELVPHYQPIIDLSDLSVAGFEALARWPASRDTADNTRAARLAGPGLAAEMLHKATAALARWRQFEGHSGLAMQVNLTIADLDRRELPDLIAQLIAAHDLPPGALCLEITEHDPVTDMAAAREALLALKQAGARLVVDDFGTGYASLSWLHHMPIDGMKVDGGIIALEGTGTGDTIIAAVAGLARDLGLTCTAEGVQSIDQARRLAAMGVGFGQGYGFAMSMPAAAAADFLAAYAGKAPTPENPSSHGDAP